MFKIRKELSAPTASCRHKYKQKVPKTEIKFQLVQLIKSGSISMEMLAFLRLNQGVKACSGTLPGDHSSDSKCKHTKEGLPLLGLQLSELVGLRPKPVSSVQVEDGPQVDGAVAAAAR